MPRTRLIRALFTLSGRVYKAHNPSAAERIAVVAVGGYGRGTLAPGSDIDLLFLLPYKQTAWGESVVEFMLYLLWDPASRSAMRSGSIDESLRLARSDSTIQTAVLEARLSVRRPWSLRGARKALPQRDQGGGDQGVHRQQARRAGCPACPDRRQSRYLVEPDVKDGKGGLRDLHTLFWIGKFIYAAKDAPGLVEKGVFNRYELRRFEKCEDFLWAVRCHLHFLRGRASDKLTFDIQTRDRAAPRLHGPWRAAGCRALHETLFPHRQGCRRSDADLLLGARGPGNEARAGPVAIFPAVCHERHPGASATIPISVSMPGA